jgi:acetyl-CoA C-acetyltransferase
MDAYILDAIRTPRGAGKATGSLAQVKPIDLIAGLLCEMDKRHDVFRLALDDFLLGCNTQTGEQGANLARIAAGYAGFENVPGATLNRFCCSSLDAVNIAALQIHAGMSDLVLAGGVESVSRVPMFGDNGAWFSDANVKEKTRFVHMGTAADLIATLEGFERAELDAYAIQSHHRAAAARDAGKFSPSLVPVKNGDGVVLLDRDELIRDNITDLIGKFAPSFADETMNVYARDRYPQIDAVRHVHHRGNSPAIADGASLVLLGSKEKAQALGMKPRAKIVSFANTACEPVIMLVAAQSATEKAIAKAGLRVQDIARFEFNEGFAAPMLKVLRDLEMDPARLNPNGGTIAMGHALGATGGMLIATLLDEMERSDSQFGVAAIMGGAGLGTATVVERM